MSTSKQVWTQKLTNNYISNFGLVEKIWSCLIFIELYLEWLRLDNTRSQAYYPQSNGVGNSLPCLFSRNPIWLGLLFCSNHNSCYKLFCICLHFDWIWFHKEKHEFFPQKPLDQDFLLETHQLEKDRSRSYGIKIRKKNVKSPE